MVTQLGAGEQDISSPTEHQDVILCGVIFGDNDMVNLNKCPLFDKPLCLTASPSFQTLLEVKVEVHFSAAHASQIQKGRRQQHGSQRCGTVSWALEWIIVKLAQVGHYEKQWDCAKSFPISYNHLPENGSTLRGSLFTAFRSIFQPLFSQKKHRQPSYE